ncbi:hypothetical protein B0T16DRAFT_414798 [Cercophora newfieldiana]|uniref:Uncharacterized protein n=1 Tax=Cercophora newfieldiana TaxID=92897 RepID=A0AA39Y6X6_9PEZI|nr:hypothetical protein B0T16DRAFT_414798 [Cercophora newfieldiana]
MLFFLNVNHTISGSVTARMADCAGTKSCEHTEDGYVHCIEHKFTHHDPLDYMQAIAPEVEKCGFRFIDSTTFKDPNAVNFVVPNKRVAHPGIERKWWVTIKVSGYNVTRSNETNPEVLCLYDLGGPLP